MSIKGLFLKNKALLQDEPEINLDPQQQEAVYTEHNKVLVVAGAGSGKTRVLTERIKYLLQQGVDPSTIVAITFTNMASEEMKSRLSNVPNISDCFIGTIHSFANKVMSVSSDKKYTILNTEVSNSFFKELIEKYCKFLTFESYLKYCDAKNEYDLGKISEDDYFNCLPPSQFAELMLLQGNNAPNVQGVKAEDYPETIKTMCERYNVITFDELLVLATKYFESIDSEISHLLIDEFQDIGTLEHLFFKSLKAKNEFFVGDDWQSIYSFKGGNVNIMLSLANSEEYKIINVDRNYRSSKAVLEMSIKVINQVTNKINKHLVIDESTPEGEVYVSSKTVLPLIVESVIKEDLDNLKDWFILVRTNKDLLAVEDILDKCKVRYTTFKREGLSVSDLNNLMNYNSLKLLTVHTAKGLEAKNVILYGSAFSLNVPKYRVNEEERKVMYVGITRAKESLVILN